jgi:hypothetical protein
LNVTPLVSILIASPISFFACALANIGAHAKRQRLLQGLNDQPLWW